MSRFPFSPSPTGWFCFGLSDELAAGDLRSLRRFGRELILFRTQEGRAAVTDAHCPHLGAHLGGGFVEGEGVRCPFHRFKFDHAGTCQALGAGYGDRIPPKLGLRAYPVRELNGFIMVWNDDLRRAPFIELPERDLAGRGPVLSTNWEIATQPQEIGEGSVDLGHLSAVHLYDDIQELHPLICEGPVLSAAFRVRRQTEPGLRGETFHMTVEPTLYGLGFSTVEVAMPSYEIAYSLWILATPIDGERTDYRTGFCMKRPTDPAKLNRALSVLPGPIARRLIERASWRAFVHDVELDFAVWENKAYIDRPQLAKGDGPIGRYRKWTRQFYPAAMDVDAASLTKPRLSAIQAGMTTTAKPIAPPTAEAQNSAS